MLVLEQIHESKYLLSMKRLAQWCLIIARSFTKEIMSVFLDLCETQNKPANVDSFLKWIHQIKNRSVIFMLKLIWGHLFPIEVYRRGHSRNNQHYCLAAEKKTDFIFFHGNSTNYQKISILRDLRWLTLKSSLLQRLV